MLGMAFNKWCFDARKRREERMALEYAMRKFLHQALSRGYNQWYDWYLEIKEQERQIRRSLARWIMAKLSAALNTWVAWYEQLIASRATLRRAISKWNQDGLLWAFTIWREGRTVSQQEVLFKAAAFWLNGKLSAAWKTWRERCAHNRGLWRIIRRIEIKHEIETNDLHDEIEKLRRMLEMHPMRRIAVEFDDDDAKMASALMKWSQLALAKGYNKLKYELEIARRNRTMALKVLTFWCNQALAKGYNSWRQYYYEILQMKRSMGFWKNRAVGMAWNTWLQWIEDLHRQRLAARNAVMRWTMQALYSAFNTWRDVLTDSMRRKNAMLRAVLRWGGSELFAAFGYWRETAEKIRVAELEFRAYLTKSYDPTERSRSRSRTSSPTRARPGQ